MKLCFALLDEGGSHKLVCAYETMSGEGVYLSTDKNEFDELSTSDKVDKLNEMISAVINVADVKRGVKFSEYARQ